MLIFCSRVSLSGIVGAALPPATKLAISKLRIATDAKSFLRSLEMVPARKSDVFTQHVRPGLQVGMADAFDLLGINAMQMNGFPSE